MSDIRHPRDLPPVYRELWEERAAIMQEGCGLSTIEANRAAFADILKVMTRDEDDAMRRA